MPIDTSHSLYYWTLDYFDFYPIYGGQEVQILLKTTIYGFCLNSNKLHYIQDRFYQSISFICRLSEADHTGKPGSQFCGNFSVQGQDPLPYQNFHPFLVGLNFQIEEIHDTPMETGEGRKINIGRVRFPNPAASISPSYPLHRFSSFPISCHLLSHSPGQKYFLFDSLQTISDHGRWPIQPVQLSAHFQGAVQDHRQEKAP